MQNALGAIHSLRLIPYISTIWQFFGTKHHQKNFIFAFYLQFQATVFKRYRRLRWQASHCAIL